MSQVAQMAGCQTECVRPSPDNAILALFGWPLKVQCHYQFKEIFLARKKFLRGRTANCDTLHGKPFFPFFFPLPAASFSISKEKVTPNC